jgi:hypothetical protein
MVTPQDLLPRADMAQETPQNAGLQLLIRSIDVSALIQAQLLPVRRWMSPKPVAEGAVPRKHAVATIVVLIEIDE